MRRPRKQPVVTAFARRVRMHRMALGLRQSDLGHRARINQNFIGEMERGEANPSLETMALVADALDCDLSELLRLEKVSSTVAISDEDMRRLKEALAVFVSVLVRPRKRLRRR